MAVSKEPWKMDVRYRPVWAYPDCPAGHGHIFVGAARCSGGGEYICHAPWCDITTFDPPENWTDRLRE